MAKKYFDTMPESLEDKIKKIFGETVAKEGNKFTKALMAARENGKKFFSVNGKEYKTEDYAKEDNTNNKSDDGEGMDKVQPKAIKKKFADRKDKDIDNDGDVDSSDRYLHKRRQAVSKAIKKEYVEAGGKNRRVAEGDKRLKANQKEESVADIIQNKNYSMREALAKVWETSANNNPFEMFGANTPSKPNQGVATVKRDQAAAAKARASGDKSNPGSFGKKKPISSQKKTDTGKPVTKVEINPKV
tara:strand:+ start:326 stop:1060 length:735 start_codon:yes stop_codon:yes gene_type:complete